MSHPKSDTGSAFLRAASNGDVYRLLAEQAGMVAYDYDVATGSIAWDGTTFALLGYTLAEFQSVDARRWIEMIHPDDRTAFARTLETAVEERAPYRQVYRILHKNGCHIHVQDRGFFVASDGPRRLVGSMVDVSDNRLREQALTALLERVVASPGREFFDQLALELSRTLDATRVFLGRIADSEDTIEPIALRHLGKTASIAPFKLAGSPSGAVLQRGDGLLCCWGNLAETLPAHSALFAEWGVNTYIGCALTTANGYRIGVLSAMFSRPPARRETLIAILQLFAARAAAEIERRKTEHALRASEARFRSLSESAPIGIYQQDETGRCVYVNQHWTDITGMSRSEALNGEWARLMHPEDEAIALADWKAISTGAPGVSSKLRIVRPDGSVRWVSVHARPIAADRDPASGYVGSLEDITEEVEAEREIRRLNSELEARVAERTAQLEATNAELEAFSYSVSHDLRSPLRAIDGFSRAIAEDYEKLLDADGRDYLRRIREATQRMALLIDDLLRLSRATRTQMRVDLVDLAALAQSIATELREADAPGREVTFVCPEKLNVRVDRDLMLIVFDNLLGNSWKYTRHQAFPRVEFSVAPTTAEQNQGQGPIYTISDNGAGFDMRYAGKLFAPFQRLHTRSEFEGTGIGLATVRRIIARHGGRVWAESVLGEGTQIHFTLKTPQSTP